MSFLRRKGWTDFSFAVGPAARTTRPEPPHPMPPINPHVRPRAHTTELPLKADLNVGYNSQPRAGGIVRSGPLGRPAGGSEPVARTAAQSSPKPAVLPFLRRKEKRNPGRLFNALGLPMPTFSLLLQVSAFGTVGLSPGISASAASPVVWTSDPLKS